MKKISKNDFLAFRKKGNFISGIHNYCDKWCERCPKTQFCEVFAMEKEFLGDNEVNLKDSLEYVSNMFEITLMMIKESMEKHKIEITNEELANTEIAIANEKQFIDSHILNKMGHEYFGKSDEILKNNGTFFNEKIIQFTQIFEDEKKQEILSLQDSFEIIRWYATMIPAKLARAVGNLYDQIDFDDQWAVNEYFGTFKVAFISVQRSMIAWAKVMENFQEKEDEILPVLVLLEKIYKQIIEICPDIEKFKRVGFED